MLESIFTISVASLIAGIIFAMPIAGPISILIVSSALNGRKRFSYQASIGAAVADFFIIFIAIYGVTKLYSYYKPAIPYLLLAGSVFLFYLAIKIFRTPVSLETFGEPLQIAEKIKEKGRSGFYTGFMLNMLNPTLLITGLISAFFLLSLVASLGFNTGGLEKAVNNNMNEISTVEGPVFDERLQTEIFQFEHEAEADQEKEEYPSYFQLLISISYAFFISLGGMIWFLFITWILTKYRRLMNIRILSGMIKIFSIILGGLSIYFVYLGVQHFV
jgi:threonine/homoserine/homoserine lactone efflux protein